LTQEAAMNDATITGEPPRTRTVRELRELVAALDRRVPHVERVGEVSIARAAASLRAAALARIEELEAGPPASPAAG
jgi:hypothetical protein